MREEYTTLIKDAKERYIKSLGAKLTNPNTGMKAYWTALKKLLNKDKVPIIPPISENNCYVTDIKEKCNIFNRFFKKQCNLIESNSILPEQDCITESIINSVKFSPDKVLEHIHTPLKIQQSTWT